MGVRVFGIAMRYCTHSSRVPRSFSILLMRSQVSWIQVDPFAEFRRDDHFPEPRVAGLLPAVEGLRRRNAFALIAKSAGFVALCHTVARDVSDRVRATA